MGLSRRAVAVLFAVLAVVLALPWPPWRPRSSVGAGECPLGFGSGSGEGLPSPHGTLSGLREQQQQEQQQEQAQQPSPPASLVVYVNASVWTGGVGASGAPLLAEAFVVDAGSGRFAFVGGPEAALAAASAAAGAGVADEAGGPAGARQQQQRPVEVVDLEGAVVAPGFVDSHLHLIPGGLSLSRLDLSAVSERGQLAAEVAAAAARLPPGQWLLGGGWDEGRWGGELPSAGWIDAVAPNTPALLMRHDAHMALANSAALRLAGVDAGTPDPAGGAILRGPDGRPSGLLTDAAIQLVAGHMPALSAEERRRALEAGVQHALRHGITFCHDMGRIAFLEGEEAAWQDLEEAYLPAANAGRLHLRIYAFVALPTWRRMAERVKQLGFVHPGGMLYWGGVKEFADGSLGSRTALMHQPYADNPGTSGTRTVEPARLRALLAAADGAGLQAAVHAIGDRAVDEVLAVYAELAANRSMGSGGGGSSSGDAGSDAGGAPSQQPAARRRPHRIEHAQHIAGAGTAARLAAAGVAVTPNPQHLLADLPLLVPRLGTERAGAGRTYAFRTLRRAGVTAAFGSDWPVVGLGPLEAIHAAVHRAPPGGGGEPAWAPEEALSPAEALAAHTLEGAAAAGLQRELGSIEAGKQADFVLLSAPPGEAAAAVQRTYVGGTCRWGCG